MNDIGRLFLNAVDALDVPVFMVSCPDFRYVFSNTAHDRIFLSAVLDREVSAGEAAGKTFDELFFFSKKVADLKDALEKAGKEKKKKLGKISITGMHRSKTVFEITCIPLAGPDGEVKYIAGQVYDATGRYVTEEQKKLINEVRRANALKEPLLGILHVLPLGVILYSAEGIVSYVNDGFCWITGYDREEIVGIHRDEAEAMILICNGISADFPPGYHGRSSRAETEYSLITKYRDVKPVEVYNIPLVKLGHIDGHVTLFREISSELDRANMAMQTVLDAVMSPVIITDSRRNILACSKSCLEITELKEDEVIGQPLEMVGEKIKLKYAGLSDQTIMGQKYTQKSQVTITTGSNRTRTLLLNETPVFSRLGDLIGFVLVGSDITSFSERQEKFIENERLAVIGRLTSSIAHEIKNPLTVISGFAEVTKSKILKLNVNESVKESMLYYQQEIIDNSRNMNRLIVDLLQLSRPKNNDRVVTNLSGALDKICNTIAPYALQKNVTVIKNLAAADLDMAIDPVQIGQVLLNLCNNAIQSMDEGGTLSISTEMDDDYVVIQVSDTGCGIKQEDIGKLGTPFFTTKTDGTGLGLSVTYSIIKDYGGRIEVESQIGKGSTFKVYLPLGSL